MSRYKDVFHMEVLVRPNDQEGPEGVVKIHITATSELMARRAALEGAWFNDMLVSRIVSIKKDTKHEDV